MHSLLDELAGGPVLLVDDLVDSRWTMTVAGRTLRRAGAGSVLPFALAGLARARVERAVAGRQTRVHLFDVAD
jgi:hypoxanthine phosphoribosyltransferase